MTTCKRASALVTVLALLATVATAQVSYIDRSIERGIDLVWSTYYPTGDFGSGAAMEDIDHDGDLDLFLGTKRGQPLAVYENLGSTFDPIGDDLDIASDMDIKQILLADLDNDGWRDLILSLWEPDEPGTSFLSSEVRMYQGGPGGTFTRQGVAVLDSAMTGLATGIAAGDYDRDGDLDLYICMWKPGRFDDTSRNRLLRNDRNWEFVDQAADLGVDDSKKSFMVSLADISGDGWPDILVTEDKRGGLTYYQNNGDGTFTDRTEASGLDGWVFLGGIYCDGMGIAVGDYDGDLDLDIYITNIFDGNLLYRNNGDGTWTDRAAASGTINYRVGWGCSFLDADNDGASDLYVLDFGMNGNSLNQDRLYRNLGNKTFDDIGPESGITYSEDGFGSATGDVDGNGAPDILLLQGLVHSRLMMNEGEFGNWVTLDLVGTDSNRDAVGAKVTVWSGGQPRFFEQMAGESYLSTNSHAIEVGLGAATQVDSVVVWWPSDQTEVWFDLAAGQKHVLTEKEAALTAPELKARWDEDSLRLYWLVHDPQKWDGFEVWLDGPGTPAMVGSMAADPTRYSYSLNDDQATEGSVYSLRATRTGSSEVLMSTVEAPESPGEPPPLTIQVLNPAPNPFNPTVTLRYFMPDDEVPSLRVLDLRGHLIARLAAPVGDGWQSVQWHGYDQGGRNVGSGTYIFEFKTSTEVIRMPMTLIR